MIFNFHFNSNYPDEIRKRILHNDRKNSGRVILFLSSLQSHLSPFFLLLRKDFVPQRNKGPKGKSLAPNKEIPKFNYPKEFLFSLQNYFD